jgi:DNA-binding PadR family transcriptional regulator
MSQKEKPYKVSSADYWILLILVDGSKHFNELCQRLPKGTIAKELNMLTKYGYVKRMMENTKPPHVSYEITEMGKKFVQYKTVEVAKQLEIELTEKLKLMKSIAPDSVKHLVTAVSNITI